MTTSFKNNAYHLLGLNGTATGRQALQRSNEIVQRLKIDDFLVYDLDIPVYQNVRTEELVKDALRRLQSPKSQLKEYFFWFRVNDDVDKRAVSAIAQKGYDVAIEIWSTVANEENEAAYSYRRNIALTHCIALLNRESSDHLQQSLKMWKSLFDSKKFWTYFSQTYKRDGDTVTDDVIADFQTNAADYLSDIYAEIQEVCGNTECVYQFRQLFDAKGERIEKDILNPAYQEIQKSIESLEQVKVGEGDVLDGDKTRQIKMPVSQIQIELNKLIEAGLYNDSSTKVLRDRAANAIRRIVLDIHNHHKEYETSDKLLAVAAQIAGTESLKVQLTAEQKQIQDNISHEQQNTIAIEIPGTFGGGTIIFKIDHVTYGGRKIFYKDAITMSYHAVNQSINLIPISQSYSFMVGAAKEKISISFGTSFYIGNKKKQQVWQQLAGISQNVIAPQIVEKLIHSIFIEGETLNIGGIEFNREGYSCLKLFGKRESISWNDPIFIPKYASGNVTVWKPKDGKGVIFKTIALSVPNAVVLPELFQACANIVLKHAKR